MKIAVLAYRLNGLDGIAKHVLLLSHALVDLGHEVDVWAVEYDPIHCFPDLTPGLNIHALREPMPVTEAEKHAPAGRRMLAYLLELWNAYQDQEHLFEALPRDYDVVNPLGDHVQWAAAAYKRRYGTPTVWMCDDFWPAARQQDAENSTNLLSKLKGWAKNSFVYPVERYDQWTVHTMDRIAVLSERLQTQMQEYYGVSSTVVRTGIVTPEVTASAAKRPDDLFQLLTVCMFMPRRRIEDVLEAVHRLRQEGVNLHYTIVGRMDHTPAYTDFVQAEVARLQLEERVTFTGEVTQEALANSFHACDAFVWPADEGQSWGMACMEAMACGKPVLVSKANGLAEVLEDGNNALLFEARNPQGLAESIKRLMTDKTLRERIAAQGQRLVQDQYSWRHSAQALVSLYSDAQRQTRSHMSGPLSRLNSKLREND
ncbi:MAG: glycosyltransferase family 4 protein [Chloroflexota bacterium]